MRLLLDTQAFLWYSAADSRLSPYACSLIESDQHERFFSIASVMEMAIKLSLGKLNLSGPLEAFVNEGLTQVRSTLLDITIRQLDALSSLPFHHRDPFDRILVAQALIEDMDVVSVDHALDAYGIRRHW